MTYTAFLNSAFIYNMIVLPSQEEAKEAYQQCLDHKFSAKAWMKLLEIYADEGNVQKALVAVVKLTVYHERWYHEIVVCAV